MKTLVQRVREAAVTVDGVTVARIGAGALLFVGVERGDDERDAETTARRIASLRFFPGRTPMDLPLTEIGGACLVVSQFTLAASLRKGNRPSFVDAEDPPRAQALYLHVAALLRGHGIPTEIGAFGADMQVALVNDGPVTFLLDVREGRVVSGA